MPTISVIVPVFKVEKYIHRCIDSILDQTFMDFELILIDDGSPDNCGRICDNYALKDSRIIVIHQKNGGLSAARNAGLDWMFANSSSNWITFIDSDDWVPPFYLKVLYDTAQLHKTKISMCWLQPTEGEIPNTNPKLTSVLRTPENAYTCNGKEISSFAQGRLYHRDCFLEYRFQVGKLFEDTYLIYKLLFRQSKIAVIEEKLYYYYINNEGIVRSPWTTQKINDLYDAMAEQVDFFSCYGYKIAEKMQIRNYLSGVNSLQKRLSKERRTNRSLLATLRQKRKQKFHSYIRKLNLNDERDAWLLTQIHPKIMWIYWHITALKNKFHFSKNKSK